MFGNILENLCSTRKKKLEIVKKEEESVEIVDN